LEKKLIGFYLLKYSSGNTQNYVNNIKYDEFGSRTYFEYGNGVSSSYIYNNATRRLQNLSTTATNGNLHNITYTYDPVGNITNITNAATGADGLGGSFEYNYSYDDLYRLFSSDGSGAIDAAYTLAMEYSPSGNPVWKLTRV
jgi:YD repeat-containing protein